MMMLQNTASMFHFHEITTSRFICKEWHFWSHISGRQHIKTTPQKNYFLPPIFYSQHFTPKKIFGTPKTTFSLPLKILANYPQKYFLFTPRNTFQDPQKYFLHTFWYPQKYFWYPKKNFFYRTQSGHVKKNINFQIRFFWLDFFLLQ